MLAWHEARQKRRSRRRAHSARRVGPLETDAFASQLVDMRCLDIAIAIDANCIRGLVVRENDNDVQVLRRYGQRRHEYE